MLMKAQSMVMPGTLIGILALLILGSAPASAEEIALDKVQTLRLLDSMSTLAPAALESHSGMTPEAASRILAFREESGRFSTVEELRRVAGLTEEQYRKIAAPYGRRIGLNPELDLRVDRERESEDDAAAAEREKSGAAAERRKRLGGRAKEKGGAAARRPRRGGLGLTIRPHYYSILPGYDLSILTEGQRKAFLERINQEKCTCGRGNETLGYCYVNDPACPFVKPRVRKIYEDIVGKPPPPADAPGER